jgi:hypothetical protein
VSLKLLVEQLCEFWERETGLRVTAHEMSKLEYTQRAETAAGRFATAAVEAMLPELSWFEEHREFSHSVRARTFLLSFPKITSGRIDGVAQPEQELRRRCQSVGSVVRAGNLYSKPDAFVFDCNTQHRPKEFAAGVPHRR